MKLQVGVKVLLRDGEGRLLLLRRAQKISDGSIVWDIPGGRIEPEEALLDALNREISEECGISDISEPRLLAAQDIFPADDRHVVRLTYQARIDGGKITLSDEHDAFEWVEPQGVDRYTVDPLIRQVLGAHHD